MPLKLCPPDPKHPTWRVRGKYLGVEVDRSTGARQKSVAQKLLKKWEEEIERGSYAPAEVAVPAPLTFSAAALSYMQAGGDAQFLEPLIQHFADKPLAQITQADVDAAATLLCPELTDASKNRKVYTPVSAIMHHAGFETLLLEGDKRKAMKRPKDSRGSSRLCWLRPPEAARLIAAARARAERLEAEIETGAHASSAAQDVLLPRRPGALPRSASSSCLQAAA
jgi:hypothetical protein